MQMQRFDPILLILLIIVTDVIVSSSLPSPCPPKRGRGEEKLDLTPSPRWGRGCPKGG